MAFHHPGQNPQAQNIPLARYIRSYKLTTMSSLPGTLTLILSGLRAVVGAFMARRCQTPGVVWLGTHAYVPVVAPLTPAERILAAIPAETWTLLWTRIGRIATRFHALYESWRAGTLPKPCAARPGRPARPPVPRLPTRQTWVVAAVGYQAAGHAAQINALMAEPEFNDFIAAVPRAGRILRPLCRILGILLPPSLRLPAKVTPTGPPRAARASPPPAPTPAPLPPLLPLAPIGFRPPLFAKRFSTP